MADQAVIWPISVVWEGDASEHPNPHSLEIGLEFLDDLTEDYTAHDAVGVRVCLVIDRLRLLLCRRVPSEFDLRRAQVVRRASGREIWQVEVANGLAVRALAGSLALPPSWEETLAIGVTSGPELDEVGHADHMEFHERWLDAAHRQ